MTFGIKTYFYKNCAAWHLLPSIAILVNAYGNKLIWLLFLKYCLIIVFFQKNER